MTQGEKCRFKNDFFFPVINDTIQANNYNRPN